MERGTGVRNVLIGPTAVPFALFALGLVAAAVSDLRGRRIPNLVVAPLLAGGLAYQAVLRGWAGAGHALLGAVLGIAILFVPFAARMIGGGDVKLLGAIGAWLGPSPMGWVTLWTAALCGVLVVLLLARHRELRAQVATNMTAALLTRAVPAIEARPRAQTVPIGAALAAAAIWVALGQEAFPHA